MTRNIKLTIEYDGTNFCGWQTQTARNGSVSQASRRSQRTVQEEIEKVLNKKNDNECVFLIKTLIKLVENNLQNKSTFI